MRGKKKKKKHFGEGRQSQQNIDSSISFKPHLSTQQGVNVPVVLKCANATWQLLKGLKENIFFQHKL